jgi:hypothetical protein
MILGTREQAQAPGSFPRFLVAAYCVVFGGLVGAGVGAPFAFTFALRVFDVRCAMCDVRCAMEYGIYLSISAAQGTTRHECHHTRRAHSGPELRPCGRHYALRNGDPVV